MKIVRIFKSLVQKSMIGSLELKTWIQITIDEAISIQVLIRLNSSFAQLLDILSHEARHKKQLLKPKNLAECLEGKELCIRNQNKATAKNTKRFTKVDSRRTNAKPRELENSLNS